MRTKIEYFVHFKFLPGLGFYGFGLTHMIGGLSKASTSILRQLIDAERYQTYQQASKQEEYASETKMNPYNHMNLGMLMHQQGHYEKQYSHYHSKSLAVHFKSAWIICSSGTKVCINCRDCSW